MHDNYPQILIAGIHGENIESKLPHTVTGDEGVQLAIEEEGTASDLTPEELESCAIVYNDKDYSRIGLIKIKDRTFAILNYTYGNNTETYPTFEEGYLDFLCTWDPN